MTLSTLNDSQTYPPIKSESPPLQSIPISSTRQSRSQFPDTAPQFRFGTRDHNLPSFSFMSQPRSSSSPTWHQPHSSISSANPYSGSTASSQPHFSLPSMDDPAVLNLTDEYDDGDELGDLPLGPGSAVDLLHDSSSLSSRALDKAVRRRSSKGMLKYNFSRCSDGYILLV